MKIRKLIMGSAIGFSSLLSLPAMSQSVDVSLNGAQEVPARTTSAVGSAHINVMPDYTISGSVTTSGVDATQAHIHEGALGKNGPVIITLSKTGANTWTLPQGSRLTSSQYQSFRNGNLYINVHSLDFKDGEIRGQIQP